MKTLSHLLGGADSAGGWGNANDGHLRRTSMEWASPVDTPPASIPLTASRRTSGAVAINGPTANTSATASSSKTVRASGSCYFAGHTRTEEPSSSHRRTSICLRTPPGRWTRLQLETYTARASRSSRRRDGSTLGFRQARKWNMATKRKLGRHRSTIRSGARLPPGCEPRERAEDLPAGSR